MVSAIPWSAFLILLLVDVVVVVAGRLVLGVASAILRRHDPAPSTGAAEPSAPVQPVGARPAPAHAVVARAVVPRSA